MASTTLTADQEPVTGVNEAQREEVADGLARMLATTYTLYLQTMYCHWNVKGSMFLSLHQLFEEQYVELRDVIDELAERIRALGYLAPGSYKAFAELSAIAEEEAQPADAEAMVKLLGANNELVSLEARKVNEIAEQAGDAVTGDMMIRRMEVHDKAAWMLRSLIAV